MGANYYKAGTWNVICDVCGFKMKSDEVRKRWDGYMVCQADWEPRHPMDFLRAPPGPKPLPWARPEQADVFIGPTYISTSVGTQDSTVPSGTFTADPLP